MAQALEIGEDPCLGHLALEAPQGGFDPFVLADCHLGHEKVVVHMQSATLASAQPALSAPVASAVRLPAGELLPEGEQPPERRLEPRQERRPELR
jgi:hypothetical protein